MKTKTKLSTKVRKKAMLNSMKSTLGNISVSAENVGISRATHYQWMKSDNNYKNEIIEINERVLDFVETALFKNIQAGKEASIFFYLKTKGKHRGYVETIHNLNTKIDRSDLEDMTDDELLAIINRKV